MSRISPRRTVSVLLTAALAVAGQLVVAHAETSADPRTQGAAAPVKSSRVKATTGGVSGKSAENAPAGGLAIYERMGSDLPALPQEKTFDGKVDEAYGAFQRGHYLTAFRLALSR